MNSISVIIPCYNEWTRVTDLVRHVFSIFDDDVQVIVSDQSGDQLISNSLEEYRNNQNFIYTKSPWSCRAETMNHGARYASADILLFLHADNQLPLEVNKELKDVDLGSYTWGGFLKLYSPFTFWTSIMTSLWNQKRKNSRQFFGDNAMRCERTTFGVLWWYKSMKLFEDVDFSKRILEYALSCGKDIYVSQYPTITSSRKYAEKGFWKIFFLQTKLQILYKLGLYNDTKFHHKYYKK